jgi:hypothetical protein
MEPHDLFLHLARLIHVRMICEGSVTEAEACDTYLFLGMSLDLKQTNPYLLVQSTCRDLFGPQSL